MKSIYDFKFKDIILRDVLKSFIIAMAETIKYYYCFYLILYQNKKYKDIIIFESDTWAKVHVFSLTLIFKMWNKKHYRSTSFQQDMIDNLQNVAIPGTGIPLSYFCYNKYICLLFVLFINPFICFMAAINKSYIISTNTNEFILKIYEYYTQHLLHPDDWFSFWRLNCRLVSYHSNLTNTDGYLQENKWTFLIEGRKLQVRVYDIDMCI